MVIGMAFRSWMRVGSYSVGDERPRSPARVEGLVSEANERCNSAPVHRIVMRLLLQDGPGQIQVLHHLIAHPVARPMDGPKVRP